MEDHVEKIEIIKNSTATGWEPLVGPEATELFNYFKKEKGLDDEGCSNLQGEALSILGKCASPHTPSRSITGIAIGYVQSGKTMSYTTLAALARDNGYRMIIVIAGISVPLLGQGNDRLREDLRLSVRADHKWQPFKNPTIADRTTLENTLADWDDAVAAGSEPQTVLVTVMKNAAHLQNLIDLLRSLRLENVPTLIIDDEADQASLNTRARRGGASSTYSKLIEIRGVLPRHSFIQYTATPQAPLLINIIDTLSPSFVEILTPGKNYTGGKHFFEIRPELVREIPPDEIPSSENKMIAPPESLSEALQIFLLGVAAGLAGVKPGKHRSMLVHPSRETTGHGQYHEWVTQIVDSWRRLLDLDEEDPDKMELLESFTAAYEKLKSTISDPIPFDELKIQLRRALRQARIWEMNATRGQTPTIDWASAYPHILVGGQAMDRGFTVEGLTVTYMPRGTGVGNADTIQQRARFFGYKLGYLGYCRVYLDSEVLNAFRAYVHHEEDIRERLLEYSASGQPLREWKRAFFLDSSLRPTRKNVLSSDYLQDEFSDSWYDPKTPHDPIEAVEHNRTVVGEFTSRLTFTENSGDSRRTPEQRHMVVEVPLKVAYEEMLTKITTVPPDDSQKYTGLLLQVEQYLERNPDEMCTVYRMGGGSPRKRSANADNEIAQLFQGSNNATGYPGDREIRGQGLTIQIHTLDVTNTAGQTVTNVPSIAVWIPSEMAQGWLVQQES